MRLCRARHNRIILEARNPARRCWRQYRVEAGTDLFGVWVVEISYGRIGTAGRSRCFVVRDEGEARHLARSILKRRESAPRRIGVPYRIRELIDPAGWADSVRAAISRHPAGNWRPWAERAGGPDRRLRSRST